MRKSNKNILYSTTYALSLSLLVTDISFDVIFILAGQAHHWTQWREVWKLQRSRGERREHEDDCSLGTNQGPTVTS